MKSAAVSTRGMSNKEVIQRSVAGLANLTSEERADMSLTDLTSSGGVGGGILVPEQADAFLDVVYDQPTIFKDARQEKMGSPVKNIDRIGFNNRLLHASPGENTALSSSNRSKPDITEIQLVAKDYVGEVDIPYDVLTDSLERGNFETHLMTHIAKRVALDLAQFALEGDTNSTDPDLAVQDGWLKLCASHTVDLAGANIDDDGMHAWYKAVPDKYLQNDLGWKMYLQRGAALDWRKSFGGRATPGGDVAIQQSAIPPFAGIPVEKDNTILQLSPSGFVRGLFVHPQNLIIGIWKEITIETFRVIQQRMLVVTVHLRAAFQVEQPDAASVLTNISLLP